MTKELVNITFTSQADAVILANLGLLLFRLVAQLTNNRAAATTAYLSRVQPVWKLEHLNINTEVD